MRDALGGGRRVEPARPTPRDLLLKLSDSLRKSFIEDGVEDVLERILGWGAEPLSPEETRNLVCSLRACLWPLVTSALHGTQGRPDDLLRLFIRSAVRLDAEGGKKGFVPTVPYARVLASLVSDLLDRAGDPEGGVSR